MYADVRVRRIFVATLHGSQASTVTVSNRYAKASLAGNSNSSVSTPLKVKSLKPPRGARIAYGASRPNRERKLTLPTKDLPRTVTVYVASGERFR